MRKYLITAVLTVLTVFLFSDSSFSSESDNKVPLMPILANNICFYEGKAYSHGSLYKFKHSQMWCFSKGNSGYPEWRTVPTKNWKKTPTK